MVFLCPFAMLEYVRTEDYAAILIESACSLQ